MSRLPRSFLLLTLLFTVFQLFADDYVISLKDLKVTSFLKGYYVDKVINVSQEESTIGFVQRGMFNRKEAAVMQPSVAAEIESCLVRSFPRNDTLKPLIVRINQLYIYELTWSSKEIACIDMSVSFIATDTAGFVELFLAGDSFERGGLDVTGLHPKNIVNALSNCFDDFYKTNFLGMLHPHRISEEELRQNPLDKPEKFAVFQKKHICKGLFKSFYNFRDCLPDSTTNFTVKYHLPKQDSSRIRATLELPSDLSQKEYYGFSDGKNIFVWAGSGFALVNREEKAISLRVDKNDVHTGASSGVMVAGVFGGMIGGAVAGLVSGLTPSGATNAAGYGKCTIDFTSGRLIPVNIPDYLKTESTTIFFLSKTTASDTRLTILHNADTLCCLSPGKYLQLSLSSKFHELKISMTGKDCISREETIPLRLFNADVYLLKVHRNREITVATTFEQVRQDLLNGMTGENTVVKYDLLQKSPVN